MMMANKLRGLKFVEIATKENEMIEMILLSLMAGLRYVHVNDVQMQMIIPYIDGGLRAAYAIGVESKKVDNSVNQMLEDALNDID